MGNTATLTLQQTVTARFTEADKGGLSVPPVGPVVWSLSDPAAGMLAPSADTLSVVFTPAKPGPVTLTGVGDTFTAMGQITVTDVAVSAAISFDAPVDAPVPAPTTT